MIPISTPDTPEGATSRHAGRRYPFLPFVFVLALFALMARFYYATDLKGLIALRAAIGVLVLVCLWMDFAAPHLSLVKIRFRRWPFLLRGVPLLIITYVVLATFTSTLFARQGLIGLAAAAVAFQGGIWLFRISPKWTHRILAVWFFLILIAPLAVTVLLHTAFGFGVLLLRSPATFLALVSLHVVAACLLIWNWRRLPSIRRLGIVLISLAFLDYLVFPVVTTVLFRPPDEAECAEVAQPGSVEFLTPRGPEWRTSQPYSLLYLPDQDLLAVSFKMAGNLILPYWNDDASNRLVLIDGVFASERHVTILPSGRGTMPELMAYDQGSRQLFVTRLGHNGSYIDRVVLTSPRQPTVRVSIHIPEEINRIFPHPDHRRLLVVTTNPNKLLSLDARSLHILDKFEIPGGDPVIWADIAPTSSKVYISEIGTSFLEVDADTHEVRAVETEFGPGMLALDAVAGTAYIGKSLFHRSIYVVDTKSMVLRSVWRLGYATRPIVADHDRDLLIVGDWFGGQIRLYRLSTREPLARPIPVGPYLRHLAYDSNHLVVFAAGKCGVTAVHIARSLRR